MAQSPRRYSLSELKRLFALSYNECAFPPCEERLAKPEWPRVQGEIAHIYGLSPGSPRYVAEMTDAERNSCENLILFCRNHHQLVDYLEPERYPADNLLDMKWAHENRRNASTDWCNNGELDAHVRKLALTLGVVLMKSATVEPKTIRSRVTTGVPTVGTSGTAAPTSRRRSGISLSALAAELNMTTDATMGLCEVLGVPVKTPRSKLNEAYADMVRRRARRDGLTT